MFSIIFPGQGSQLIGMGKEFFDKYDLVKKLFRDKGINNKYSFTAVNSINWFRVLPQSIYYAWSYLNHNIDLNSLADIISTSTQQLAKRQITWKNKFKINFTNRQNSFVIVIF